MWRSEICFSLFWFYKISFLGSARYVIDAVLLRIAEAMSAGNIDHVPEWFTEGFKLHDPSFGGFRSGHEGARDMLRSLAEHVPSAIDALDMVEEGAKIAVRWLFSGKNDGGPV
jgi:hypothetical protein